MGRMPYETSGRILVWQHRTDRIRHKRLEYKEVLRLITRNEEKLLATMTDKQKELFSRYTDAVREYQTMTECLLFRNSFKLGARLMLEVMEE